MGHPHKGRKGFNRLLWAVRHSGRGLRDAYLHESAFRQESWLAMVLVPAAVWIGQDWTEVVLLAGSVALVLIVELLNSGIEAAIDRISFDHHDLSRRAKDLASAAVAISLMSCAGIWATALWRWLAI